MDKFWREFARSRLSPSAFAEADRRQREYDRAMEGQQYAPGPGIVSRFVSNFRANRAADQYWREHRMIERVLGGHRSNDLGHPPGCTCRFCFRGRIEYGRDH